LSTTYTIITLLSLALFSHSQDLELSRESYPLNPKDTQHTENNYKEQNLDPTSGVDSLIKQEKWLRSQLNRFPIPESKSSPPQNKFGFLCPLKSTYESGKNEAWVELTLNKIFDVNLDGIALIPALFHKNKTDSNYGFPKRFKIEAFKLNSPKTPITLVDWTTQDFPDPGLSPVVFSFPNTTVHKIRLIVTKGTNQKDGHDFFALDELMVFRSGVNIAPPLINKLTCSNQSFIPPYWQLQYLVDGLTHLGQPLAASQNTPDFIQYFNPRKTNTQPSKKQIITIDLEQEYSIGRLELYAAHEPNTPIPSIPLPKSYKIELLKSLNPESVSRSYEVTQHDLEKTRLHPLNSINGRYLRLTFKELPIHQGRPVLALGEIRIIGDHGHNQGMLELNKKITLSTKNKNTTSQASTIIDGFVNGRPITPEKLYLEQLAKRALVEKSHRVIIESLYIAKALRTQRYRTTAITLVALTLIGLFLLMKRNKKQKELEIHNLQKQIAADLHDDISGNLGTISMITNRLHKISDNKLTKDKLREINHLSKESYLSVKEIIWHTDSEIIHLSDLLNKIKRTAQSILSDSNIRYEFQENFDDREIPVKMRRNIMLLVKESLYNCAKYAQANNMLIKTKITKSDFTLTMRDDGCGFDTSCEDSGRGLINMEQRAKLLGANLTIQSKINQGTEIKLNMPLTNN